MGRLRTEEGEWGKITVTQERPDQWVAFARIRNHRGRLQSIQRGAATAAKAEARLKDAMRAEARKLHEGDISADTPFREVAEGYLGRCRRGKLAATTVDRYEHALRSVLFPEIGDLPVRKLTARRLQVLFDTLADAGREPAGLALLRAPLSGTLKLAVLDGALRSNPALAIQLPAKGTPYTTGQLTTEQIHTLVAAAATDDRMGPLELHDILVLLLGTGARISEILGLRWWDVALGEHWRDCTLHIRHNAVHVRGRGMQFQKGKTPASRRLVLMTPQVREVMRRRAGYVGLSPEQPVFMGSDVTRPRTPSRVREKLRTHYGEVPLLRDTTQPTHVFRKAAATAMLDQGIPPEVVADQLGHASMHLVLQVYRMRRQSSPEAMNALDYARRDPGEVIEAPRQGQVGPR